MELFELENIAKKEKIDIVNFKMNKNKARIVNYDNPCIFMDYSKINTYTDEKCVLAEELGHYYYDSYYTLSSSQEEISKKEFRATKWAFKTLVPYRRLIELHEEGCNYSYEFAEELGVTEDLIEKAYSYYSEGNYS